MHGLGEPEQLADHRGLRDGSLPAAGRARQEHRRPRDGDRAGLVRAHGAPVSLGRTRQRIRGRGEVAGRRFGRPRCDVQGGCPDPVMTTRGRVTG